MAKPSKAKRKDAGPTPKELVRSRQARRQKRNIAIGLGAVAVVIIGLLAAGLIQEFVIKPRRPVAIVDGVRIRTDEYQKRVRFEYDSLQRQLSQWLQFQLQYGTDDQGSGIFDQQIAQLRAQLDDPATLSLQVLEKLIDEELMRKNAPAMGVQVTDVEIADEIERQFGFVRNPTPTPIVTPEVITTTEIITGTDGVTTTQVTSATATPWPTVALMTETEFRQNYESAMSTLAKSVGFSEADFRNLITMSLLEQKLREVVGQQVPTTEEQVWARHILIMPDAEAEDQEAAQEEAARRTQEAYERLQAGEEMADLAQELSDDVGSKEDGGDLGWFGRGLMMPEFEAQAFALAPGEVSQPFTTTYGYHIIQVLEKDPAREVDPYILSQQQSQAFDAWLEELQQSAVIERFWSLDKVPPTPTPATGVIY